MPMPLIARIRHWVLDRLVQDVPESLSACEFDCRKPHCSHSASSPCSLRSRVGRAPTVRTCAVVPMRQAGQAASFARRARPALGNANR